MFHYSALMRQPTQRLFLSSLLFCGLSLFATANSYAACHWIGQPQYPVSQQGPGTAKFTFTPAMNGKTIATSKSDPVGKVYAKSDKAYVIHNAAATDCIGTTYFQNNIGASIAVLNNNVFPTNVPGIGYRIQINGGLLHWNNIPYLDNNGTHSVISSVANIPLQYELYLELINTGPVYGGTLNSGKIASWHWGANRLVAINMFLNPTIKIAPSMPTCSSPSAVTVDFGQVNPSTLSSAVRTSTVASNCEAGVSYNLAISGTADTANAALLKNTGTAKGLGILVTTESGISLVPNGTNTYWLAPNSSAIRVKSTLTKTGSPADPTSGTISALATLTINYQ